MIKIYELPEKFKEQVEVEIVAVDGETITFTDKENEYTVPKPGGKRSFVEVGDVRYAYANCIGDSRGIQRLNLSTTHKSAHKADKPLTQEQLKSVLEYNPDTGEFVALVDRGYGVNKVFAGEVLKGTMLNGYRYLKLNYVMYPFHRLAFLYMNGEFPRKGIDVDHINKDRADCRWLNLHLVSRSGNQKNRKIGSNNTSGIIGVSLNKLTGNWVASIKTEDKTIRLGEFTDKAEAAEVRKMAEEKYGFSRRHGNLV